MFRQRLRERTSPLIVIGRIFTLLLALALIWYGLMLVLLALKVSGDTVNSISGYRTAFDWLGGLQPRDVDGAATRAIVAGAGLVTFLVCGYAALKQLPRPYLARRELALHADDHGEVTIEPRAVERLAEIAAREHPSIIDARGRYAVDDLSVDITVRRARDVPDALRDAQQRVVDALGRHELPAMPVNVTLTGYDRKHKRELQ